MNGAHLHLVINHFPVVGLVFAAALLLASLVRKNPELARAGMFALVAVAIVSIPVYLTGEPAEEIVEHLPGMSGDLIEAHEETAIWAFILLEVIGALAVLGLVAFRPPRPMPTWFLPALFAAVIVTIAWVGWVSSLGGRINHPEARPGFEAPAEME